MEIVDTKALIQPGNDKEKTELAVPGTSPSIQLEPVGAGPVMMVRL